MAISTDSIISLMRDELGSVFSTESHSDAKLISNISSAIRFVANKRDFSFLKRQMTVIVPTANVEVTTPEKVKTIFVYLGEQERIPLGIDEYYIPGISAKYVGSWEDKFIAKEAGTYSLMVTILPTLPTSVTDTIDMPSYMSDVLFNSAMGFAKKNEHMYADAQFYFNIAEAMIRSTSDRSSNQYPKQQASLGSRYNIM